MKIFPLFEDMTGKTFLVVGAGAIARRKIRLILQFTDRVLVITNKNKIENSEVKTPGIFPDSETTSPDDRRCDIAAEEAGSKCSGQAEEDLAVFARAGARILDRPFEDRDLEAADLCIASSDDPDLNHHIADLCFQKKIPVNVPDDPTWCSFYLPAVVKRGDLVIAISTGGKSPAMAGWLRRKLDKDLPADIEQILDLMGDLRNWLPGRIDNSSKRGEIYKAVIEALLEGDLDLSECAVRTYAEELFDPDLSGGLSEI